MLAVTWMLTINILKNVKKKEGTKKMANSNKKTETPTHLFSMTITPVTLPQAIYIDAIVIPEINVVLQRHAGNLKELGKEI